MKILIDFSQIPLNKTGVGIYGEYLIKALAAQGDGDQYLVLVQQDETAFDELPGITLLKLNSRRWRNPLLRILIEQLYLPILLYRRRIGVLHSLHYTFPLVAPGVKRVVTLHDMSFIHYPELHKSSKVPYFRFFISRLPSYADKIIAVSRATLDDYNAIYPTPAERTAVVHHGKQPIYHPNHPHDQIEGVKQKYHISDDYMLFIGTLEPRKNIDALIRAFAMLDCGTHPLKLVIAGGKGWLYETIFQEVERLQLRQRVIFTGYIAEEEKPLLISGAKLFLYPSLYEGFGLPILEAMACGTPTITSNSSCLPEIAGDGALLVDPQQDQAILGAMQRLLNDPMLYSVMSERAVRRAEQFSWQRTARETAEVYHSCHQT
jgi:glycosyltransferase involved in cell wall biosynthesis